MDVELPHLAWPLTVNTDGRLAVVEEDTRGDVRQCVRVLLNTPIGSRMLAPQVGVEDPTFTEGVDPAQLQAILHRDEPRADITVTADPVDPVGRQNVRVTVELAD